MRTYFCLIFFALTVLTMVPIGSTGHAAEPPCIAIFHDESGHTVHDQRGPINAILLANLLGHWPQYEVRVKPVFRFKAGDFETCKANIYIGTDTDAALPKAFLEDFFKTSRNVAWLGFGQHQLNRKQFVAKFKHIIKGQLGVDKRNSKKPGFYQHVVYKERVFSKSIDVSSGRAEGAFQAVRFVPAQDGWQEHVVGRIVHNKTKASSAYMLRADNRFLVGDIPMAYMHEGDRYFAFADLLFDIIGETADSAAPKAFARTEDIHALYETYLLDAVLQTHTAEDVPLSIAHIPLFMDPLNAFGGGNVTTPIPAHQKPAFSAFIKKMQANPRNYIIWHGVTHQLGTTKNPHSGTSGDDYEFWDMTKNRIVPLDTPTATVARLKRAMPVFEDYKSMPRFWVTPHYHGSAITSRVLAKIMPWNIGRVTYYASSFGPEFTLPVADKDTGVKMPDLTRAQLEKHKHLTVSDADTRSLNAMTQMFPFIIYRDVYGQRIVPETLGYLSYQTSDQTAFVRTVDDMLADARRNQVVRDYWASFFYHPYIFANKEDGGIGRFPGDTMELRKLFIGLKMLGYHFTSLAEFEGEIGQSQKAALTNKDQSKAN